MTKKQKLSKMPRAYRMRLLTTVLDAIESAFKGPLMEEDVRRAVEAAMTVKFGGYSVVKR